MSETNDLRANPNSSGVRAGLYHSHGAVQQGHERLLEVEKLRREREAADPAVRHAAAVMDERTDEPARSLVAARTTMRMCPLMAAVVALVISVTPTLYDYIFVTLSNEMLNRVASLGSAAFIGLFITWGIAGSANEAGQPHVAHWGGMVGGAMVGIGLGLLRVAHAEGKNELAFAVALTVAESLGTKIWRMSRACPAAMSC